jgi:DNA-binding PadR family transcriptional regulator
MRGNINPFPSSEYALLGLLLAGPAHGYMLHKAIAEPDGIGLIWGVKISNLYAQLNKLEKKHLILGILKPGESHPNKTQYFITAEGEQELTNWLKMLVRHPRDFRQEFMVKYYFTKKYSPESVNDLVKAQLEECQSWLTNTNQALKTARQESQFTEVILKFRSSQINSMVDWLEWLLTQSTK